MKKLRIGFKSKNQLPLLMIWEEYWHAGEIVDGRVLFNTMNLTNKVRRLFRAR